MTIRLKFGAVGTTLRQDERLAPFTDCRNHCRGAVWWAKDLSPEAADSPTSCYQSGRDFACVGIPERKAVASAYLVSSSSASKLVFDSRLEFLPIALSIQSRYNVTRRITTRHCEWPAGCQVRAPGMACHAPTKQAGRIEVDRDVRTNERCRARCIVPLRNHRARRIEVDGDLRAKEHCRARCIVPLRTPRRRNSPARGRRYENRRRDDDCARDGDHSSSTCDRNLRGECGSARGASQAGWGGAV